MELGMQVDPDIQACIQRPCPPRTREEGEQRMALRPGLKIKTRKIHQRQKIIGKSSHFVILIHNLYLDIYVLSICVLTQASQTSDVDLWRLDEMLLFVL